MPCANNSPPSLSCSILESQTPSLPGPSRARRQGGQGRGQGGRNVDGTAGEIIFFSSGLVRSLARHRHARECERETLEEEEETVPHSRFSPSLLPPIFLFFPLRERGRRAIGAGLFELQKRLQQAVE